MELYRGESEYLRLSRLIKKYEHSPDVSGRFTTELVQLMAKMEKDYGRYEASKIFRMLEDRLKREEQSE